MLTNIKERNASAMFDAVDASSLAQKSNGDASMKVDQPRLTGRWPNGASFTVEITHENFTIGRAPDCDLVTPATARYVSGRHVEIQRTPVGYAVVDLGSTNGTRLNNRGLPPQEAVALNHGDIIRIGSERYGSSIGFAFQNIAAADKNAPVGFDTMINATNLLQVTEVTVGRDPANQIVLHSPTVARRHAVVRQFDEHYHLIQAVDDHPFAVNGEVVRQAHLQPGDIVQIGSHVLIYDGATLVQYTSQGYRVDVVDLHKTVKTKSGSVRILDEISFTIMPREFVALVGGSGAGKSTLLDALNGFRPAQGQVLVNGRDLYQHYDEFRTQMGYVPQYDILPTTLTVDAALHYAAELRLAADISATEREERIAKALETVEMNSKRLRSTRISRLSGGQRKRVSIAAELLADPKIFFLDEPASGLDPGLEKKLMYTLRKMADEGRTIIMITHATDNITQVDHVAFLAQGKLIYYGPPASAQPYFEVDEFADIYEKIEAYGDEWRRVFTQEKSAAYQQYVVQRQRSLPKDEQRRGYVQSPMTELMQGVRQLNVLSRRMVRLILSDWIALFVLLFVMPFVAVQQLLVANTGELVGDATILGDLARATETLTSNYLPAITSHTFLFGMAMLAFLVGAFGGSQELIKERPVYLRERMVNLGILPYLTSKILVYGSFALIQVACYVGVLMVGLELPSEGQLLPGAIEMGITLFLTVMTGIATGLFISSISPNSTVAMYLVLIRCLFPESLWRSGTRST